MFDPAQDLEDSHFQAILHEQLQEVVFVAALDCSTKTRARDIPRDLGDGKPCQPLHNDQHWEGLPSRPMKDQVRVSRDNLEAHVADGRLVGHQV